MKPKKKDKEFVILEYIIHSLALIAIGLLIYTCFFVQSFVPKVVSIVINIMTLGQWAAFNIITKKN
nr:MAG TPA: hypothetical protein [Bacteriophage sp.]